MDYPQVTEILLDPGIRAEDRLDALAPLVYDQLRAVARHALASERPDHSLDATALVHEAFVRLSGDREIPWQNRAHFYAAAVEAMRRILVDHARTRGRLKRGGGRERVPLSVADIADSWELPRVLQLDEAIQRLRERSPVTGEVIRLRFFAGLGVEQTAAALGVSTATVRRKWELGRTWLYRELGDGAEHDRAP